MKKVLIFSNNDIGLYNFRKEIIDAMIKEGYKVYISLPYGEKVDLLIEMGCEFIDTKIDRRSTNIINDIKLILKYFKILGYVNPDVVLTYTVKPNLYGGIASKLKNIPYICNITGLGSGYLNGGIVRFIIEILSKISFKGANTVFFQNENNMSIFIDKKIINNNYYLLPGSGVNINEYNLLPYNKKERIISFNFIARIMKDKGIDEYLEAAKIIKSKYSNVRFNIIGEVEEYCYYEILNLYQESGIIEYYGFQNNIRSFIENGSCIINPSYSEGMSNVLLETASSGRPIIASDIPGCREIIDDNINGYLFEVGNIDDLVNKIEKFINIDILEKEKMGIMSRLKIEKEFDRNIIINKYISIIKEIN